MVPIPVSPETAKSLADEAARAEMGSEIDRIVRARRVEKVRALIGEIKADARQAGLTDAGIDADLAAYKAERRS
jgi:hypothetical protein